MIETGTTTVGMIVTETDVWTVTTTIGGRRPRGGFWDGVRRLLASLCFDVGAEAMTGRVGNARPASPRWSRAVSRKRRSLSRLRLAPGHVAGPTRGRPSGPDPWRYAGVVGYVKVLW